MDERQGFESGGAVGTAQDVAVQAKEQARQTAGEVRAKAADEARGQVDKRSSQIADQITPFAQALHIAGDHLERQGSAPGANAARRLAGQMEQLSGYLRGSGSDRLLGDVESFARRRPWAAGSIGVAVGFVGARFLKASSESRYAGLQPYGDIPASEMPLQRESETPLQRETATTWVLPAGDGEAGAA